MTTIKITRTSTVEYKAKDQDLAYYVEHEAFNNDLIALQDLKDVEKGDIDLDDIDGGSVEHEYKVVLVEDDPDSPDYGKERAPDEDNTDRDYNLFPDDDEDVEDDEAEVAMVNGIIDEAEMPGANDPALQ